MQMSAVHTHRQWLPRRIRVPNIQAHQWVPLLSQWRLPLPRSLVRSTARGAMHRMDPLLMAATGLSDYGAASCRANNDRPRLAATPTVLSSHQDTLVQNGCLPVLLLNPCRRTRFAQPMSCGAAGFLALNYLLACPRPAAEAAGAAVTVRRLSGVTSLRGDWQTMQKTRYSWS